MPRATSGDDFKKLVRDKVATLAGHHCSNPKCQRPTSGPAEDPAKSISIGTAAHITAAVVRGPRYDASLTPTQQPSVPSVA